MANSFGSQILHVHCTDSGNIILNVIPLIFEVFSSNIMCDISGILIYILWFNQFVPSTSIQYLEQNRIQHFPPGVTEKKWMGEKRSYYVLCNTTVGMFCISPWRDQIDDSCSFNCCCLLRDSSQERARSFWCRNCCRFTDQHLSFTNPHNLRVSTNP